MAQGSYNKKIANGLVAAGTAAVLAVYAAGYERTRSAADQLDAQSAGRRAGAPGGRGAIPAIAQPLPASSVANADTPSPVSARDENRTPVQVASLNPPQVAPESTPAERKTESAPVIPDPASLASPVTPAPPASTVPTPAPAIASVAPAVTPAPAAVASKWKDGTYLGWGSCRHGDIQAQIIIAAGRITSATIAQCLTRYSCDIIGRLPPEVLQRQSPEVDYVSGATQSADAFFYAVSDALSKAK